MRYQIIVWIVERLLKLLTDDELYQWEKDNGVNWWCDKGRAFIV